MNKLDTPMALGYSNVGIVIAVGSGVTHFKVGDRVVSNGPHAEVVQVPENLCAKIPENVSNESASFAIVSAIALQGIRLSAPTLGETFVVTGLGLIGLLTAQILKANGCQVIGFDFDRAKVELAKSFGVEAFAMTPEIDPMQIVNEFSGNEGADAVIITASTQSDEPISQAAQMCRKRGRVVLVGVVGLNIDRSDFYEKEITFQVSCSYGPGRYEPNYEQKNYDYPIGFVRWTENRNFKAILNLMNEGKINCQSLITRNVELPQTPELYSTLDSNTNDLGILINYSSNIDLEKKVIQLQVTSQLAVPPNSEIVVGVIGAGNFKARKN